MHILFKIQDLNINIVRVNAPWQKSDHHKDRKSLQMNYIHFDCTPQQRNIISQKFGRNIDFTKHDGKCTQKVVPKNN